VSTSRPTALWHDLDLDHAQARWRRSSYSGGANDCVEVADLGAWAAVRDSKDVRRGPLLFSKAAMSGLVGGIADGVLDERRS
jgi:hypothetical protein